MSILEVLIALAIFGFVLMSSYRGLEYVVTQNRMAKSYRGLSEFDSFIQSKIWQMACEFSNSQGFQCSAAAVAKVTPTTNYFNDTFVAFSRYADYRLLKAEEQSAFSGQQADFQAANDRCKARSLVGLGPTSQSFYTCVTFRRTPGKTPPNGSIFQNLGVGQNDNKVLVEFWVGYRHVVNPNSSGVTCEMFGDHSAQGFLGQMVYTIHYIENMNAGGATPRWVYKRVDRTLSPGRTF